MLSRILFTLSLFFATLSAYPAYAVPHKVGEVQSGAYVITDNVATIESWMESQFESGTNITSVAIEAFTGGSGTTYYLTGYGSYNGNARTIAVLLDLSGTEFFVAASKTSHTCTGNPCSECSFTRSNSGVIVGCNCYPGSGSLCNHTTTTDTSFWY